MRAVKKDPGATLDFGFDWSTWLGDGETITKAAWTVPEGITEHDSTSQEGVTAIWLKGGTAGLAYTVTVTVTTSAGRTDERSLRVEVMDR